MEKVWEALVQSQVRFNRVPEKVPGEGLRLGCRARSRFQEAWVQSQVRFGSGDGLGSFGAGLGQVQQGSGGGYGEGLGGFGAEPGQVQEGSGEGSGEGSRKPWCKAKSGSTGSGEGCGAGPEKVLGIFGAGPGQDRVSSAWLGSKLQKDFLKIKRCGCWGYHRSLFCFGIVPMTIYIPGVLVCFDAYEVTFLHSTNSGPGLTRS